MTTMKDRLKKYLLGKADERETRQLEELLSRETVDELSLNDTSEDSLLSALRIGADQPQDAEAIRQMTEQLEKLIPRPDISAQEIRELLEPAESPELLGRIGKYQITQYLASGGMGLVFRASDSQLNREVCLKLLHPFRARGSEARTRFDRESRAIARLNCERIMPILDLGIHRDLPFLVMPLLEGTSLRSLLLREGRLPIGRAVRLATQIAEGLEFAHQMGVLHRDIKPDNLWVTQSDNIKLLDFGLARTSEESTPITHEGTLLGTPSYMSPEQVTGKPLDERSDLFSLGVVLVEMLTGDSPFRKNNLFSTLMSVASDEIKFDELDPDSKFPVPVRELLESLLQKKPDLRPSSAGELVARLKLLCEMQEPVGPRSSRQTHMSGAGRSSWWRTITAAVGGFALCVGALTFWQMNDKGILVVKTSDPQVEVKIAGEKVTVVDPLTSRSFEIRIGATPLPSGVYQLEWAETNRDLIFSSQTIAIRRGEQTIVTVELQPLNESPSELAASSESEIHAPSAGVDLNKKSVTKTKAAPGATLCIYLPGLLPPNADTDAPILQVDDHPPLTGVPVTVKDNGTISIPGFGEIPVADLNTEEICELIRKNNREKKLLPEGFEISIGLLMQPGEKGTIRNLANNKSSVAGETEASATSIELNPSPLHSIPPLEPVPTDQIVDKSYDPQVRDRFAEVLKSLPALPLEKHFPQGNIAPTAVVQKSGLLNGISAWSLELPPETRTWQANVDSTLFATLKDQVWIVDAQGAPKFVLPTSGALENFAFDSVHPNLIATATRMGELGVGINIEADDWNRFLIQVWRLGSQGAELIAEIPSSSREIIWDQGYRLIHILDNNIVAHRLDSGKSTVLTKELDNRLQGGSISPRGRFLATGVWGVSNNTNIYDLHRGAFVSSIRLAGDLQWRSDDSAISVTAENNEFLEIWRTDTPEFLQRVDLLKRVDGEERSWANKSVLDQNFSRVAQLTSLGDLTIRSLLSQRESSLRMEGFQGVVDPQLDWKPDGTLSISADAVLYNWKSTDSEVHGILSIGSPVPLNSPPTKTSSSVLTMKNSMVILSRMKLNDPNNLEIVIQRHSLFDLEDLGNDSPKAAVRLFKNELDTLSPDGRFYIQPIRDIQFTELKLVDIAAEKTTPVGTFINHNGRVTISGEPVTSCFTYWSTDSRQLLLAGKMTLDASGRLTREGMNQTLEIWNARESTCVKIPGDARKLFGGGRNLPTCFDYGDGFLIQTGSPNFFELHWLQAKSQSLELLHSDELDMKRVRLVQVAGEHLFVSSPSEFESQTILHRAKIQDGKMVQTGSLIFGQDDQIIVAPDANRYCCIAYDPASLKVSGDRRGRSVQIKSLEDHPATVTIGEWPNGMPEPQPIKEIKPLATWKTTDLHEKPVWHSNGRFLAVYSSQCSSVFSLDLETKKWHTVSYHSLRQQYSNLIHPTDFGWLISATDRLLALNHNGELLGTFLLGANSTDTGLGAEPNEKGDYSPEEILRNGRWILADGFTLSGRAHSRLQIVFRRDQQIRVASLDAYLADPLNPRLPQTEKLPFSLK